MDNYTIAIGPSAQSKAWKNKQVTFEKLVEKLSTPIRTFETVQEYKKMTKADKTSVKDKGGFVGGALIGPRRLANEVKYRSLITLDVDDAKVDFLDSYSSSYKYKTFIYSTHSHTKEKPRLRLILPLSREANVDEYNAISRYFADEIGIDQVDPCSFRVNQLMYWPTAPSDGEFISILLDGDIFDVDSYLSSHPNWEDISTLPTSEKETKVQGISSKKQEDPTLKRGVIGAFCRTYSISKAIDTFLSDVYEECITPNRYTYKKGTSFAGAICYDDKFLYSHHATDPAYGLLLNSYDLVRIHKFGELDDKESNKAMKELIANDDNITMELLALRQQDAIADFSEDGEPIDKSWMKKLKRTDFGDELKNCSENLVLILENDPSFKNIAYNEFAHLVEVVGDVPWRRPERNKYWREADTAQMKAIIDRKYAAFSDRNYDVAFGSVTDNRSFHPIRDYLNSLPEWDGVKRVETLFIDYFNATDNHYVRSITWKTFVACVARILKPGVKFDCMLVLDGKQGIGKSSIINFLAGDDYFSDSLTLTDMSDKTGSEKLQGFWIVEIGELAGMKKADVERVKGFLSCKDDKYRPSFGHHVESHPRQSVIIATVNGERGYLRDITGNRRYWILKLNQETQGWKWKKDSYFRDQFWAEAVHIYKSLKNDNDLFLKDEDIETAEEEQRKAMEVDERVGLVESYLETLLPNNWDEMDIYQRRDYLDGDITSKSGTIKRTKVSNSEIWCECFRKNLSEIKPSDSYQIAAIMVQIGGWQKQKTPRKIPIYGNQRLYLREGD